MFKQYDKVVSRDFDTQLKAGVKGEVLVPKERTFDWVGVKFPGLKFGHDLAGHLPKGSTEGYWVAEESLKLDDDLFKVGTWVKVIEEHDSASKGQVGIIRKVRVAPGYQPYSVEFPGWTGGHDLYSVEGDVKLVGEASHSGHYLPGYKLTKVRKPYTRKPKVSLEPVVGSVIKMTKSFDNARVGYVGTIVTLPEAGSSYYGAKFPEDMPYDRGHSLGSRLSGSEATTGQWVARDSFAIVYNPKPEVLEPPILKDAVADQLADAPRAASGFNVTLTEAVKNQDGTFTASPNEYHAQVVKVSGRNTILVSFGKGHVLIFEEDDKRIKLSYRS